MIKREYAAKRLKRSEDKVETVPLWHGTAEAVVTQIARGIFDRRHCGKNGMSLMNLVYKSESVVGL